YQSEVTALRRELEVILDSTIWRASAPLRTAAGKLPPSLKSFARTGLQAVYWVLTPWKTPKRIQYLRERYREAHGKAELPHPPIDDRPNTQSSTLPDIEAWKVVVQNSGLFDPAWYQSRYGDVAAARLDPFEHFVRNGSAERRSPGPNFDA